jgi:hypothetical protein
MIGHLEEEATVARKKIEETVEDVPKPLPVVRWNAPLRISSLKLVPLWTSSQKLMLKGITAGRSIWSTTTLTLFAVLLRIVVLDLPWAKFCPIVIKNGP